MDSPLPIFHRAKTTRNESIELKYATIQSAPVFFLLLLGEQRQRKITRQMKIDGEREIEREGEGDGEGFQ